jgi:ATP-dependent DNA ligase
MIPSLAKLKTQCQELGYIVHRKGFRPAKSDYLAVLRQHYIKKDFPQGLPYTELSPMLCLDYHRLLPKAQERLWKDDNGWVAQEKIDGARAILHFVWDVGVFAQSRVISVKTFRRSLLTDRLPFHDCKPSFTATVDCEAVWQGTKLTLHVFDIVRWGDLDLRKKQLCERLAFLADFKAAIVTAGLQDHFDFPGVHFTKKREFYESVLTKGGEGVVLKNLASPYHDSLKRAKAGWVKVKRQLAFEAFVSWFDQVRQDSRYNDRVACLIFSLQTDSGPCVIAKVANLPSRFRREVSVFDKKTGSVALRLDVLGRVASVAGLEISRKARRLSHPKILRWRPDLRPEDCSYVSSDIEATSQGATNSLPLRAVESMKGGEEDSPFSE